MIPARSSRPLDLERLARNRDAFRVELFPDGRVVTSFAGLHHPSVRLLAAVFLLTQVFIILTSEPVLEMTWQDVIALLVVAGASVLVLSPGPVRLSAARTAAVVASVVVSTVLMESMLPSPAEWLGYSAWHFGANMFVMVALGFRGRIGAAWLGMLLMTAITVVWAEASGGGALAGVALIDAQAAMLLIGTAFAIGMGRMLRRTAAYHRARGDRAALSAERSAQRAERLRQLGQLEERAIPALERIATGAPPTPEERRDWLVIEAELRDRVRAVSLAREPLLSAVSRARRRGIDVVLLDDSGGLRVDEPERLRLLRWAAEQLDASRAVRKTVRLRADGKGGLLLTVAGDAGSERSAPIVTRTAPRARSSQPETGPVKQSHRLGAPER